ncbi:MAG TPA: hypothetical protein PLH91_03530 [Tenuifilaceae bacterium]|nr:hypothetical protein [Tenuifilaceae bacterium]HPV56317.1 hypothetical protein [Tenuifilaceae bacterium]
MKIRASEAVTFTALAELAALAKAERLLLLSTNNELCVGLLVNAGKSTQLKTLIEFRTLSGFFTFLSY